MTSSIHCLRFQYCIFAHSFQICIYRHELFPELQSYILLLLCISYIFKGHVSYAKIMHTPESSLDVLN